MQDIPKPPHAAIVKVWGKGPKNNPSLSNKGEILYNSNELEPHVALQITERAIRLSLSHDMLGNDAIIESNAINSEYDKDNTDKKSSLFPPRSPPMWNGPTRKAPLPWDGSGGNARTRQQLTGRL